MDAKCNVSDPAVGDVPASRERLSSRVGRRNQRSNHQGVRPAEPVYYSKRRRLPIVAASKGVGFRGDFGAHGRQDRYRIAKRKSDVPYTICV
jgi:hypothetical protein